MSPRFEIKAIRSWTRSRLDRARGDGATDGNGTAPQNEDLMAVLEAYDLRFETAAAEERTVAERQEEFREEAARLLEEVIEPALADSGRQIAEHGHEWNVESRVDILGQPAVACAFRPREKRVDGGGTSDLTFRFLFPDRLTVAAAAKDGGEMRELPPRSYDIAALDADLVRREVTRFVKGVIAHA